MATAPSVRLRLTWVLLLACFLLQQLVYLRNFSVWFTSSPARIMAEPSSLRSPLLTTPTTLGTRGDHASTTNVFMPLMADSPSSNNATTTTLRNRVALAYIAIGLFPRPTDVAPVFAWAMYTLAAHGQFTGHVVIITDAPFAVESLLMDVVEDHPLCPSQFHVVEVDRVVGEDESSNMEIKAKSYKTKLFDMLPESIKKDVDRIFYVDSDVLIIQPMDAILRLAQTAALASHRRNGNSTTTLQMVRGGVREPWHSGVILFSRMAQDVMQEWGNVIASGAFVRDQLAFQNCTLCMQRVEPLPRSIMYFPDVRKPVHPNAAGASAGGSSSSTSSVPPPTGFVHYTSTKRARLFMKKRTHWAHRRFLERIGGIPERCLNRRQLSRKGSSCVI